MKLSPVSLYSSVVRQALNPRTRTVVVAKEIDLRYNEPKFLMECSALSALDHPNIVKYFASEKVGSTGYIFMQLLESDTLHRTLILRPEIFGTKEILQISSQLHQALSYIHRCGIAHRDFKVPDCPSPFLSSLNLSLIFLSQITSYMTQFLA
jgi:serine/threonine protein kinase